MLAELSDRLAPSCLFISTLCHRIYSYHTAMSDSELQDWPRDVGEAFKDGFHRTGQFAANSDFAAEDKLGNGADCVTAVDRYIEETIFTRLRAVYPTHQFVGEETTAEHGNGYKVTDQPTWIVDPVDGTNNFVHHFPYTGISIGPGDQQAAGGRRPVPAGIGRAVHGGARTRRDSLTRLLLDKEDGGACVQNLRVIGAAAPDLALVAKGSAEIYWECGPHAWDFAAGALLVTESGGAVFDGAGFWGSDVPENDRVPKPLDLWKRKIVAVRYIPDLDGQPGSGRELQRKLAKELLDVVEDIDYPADGCQ
ncbi:carbohydrate phosphatase [Linderina pennispora]|uniref:Carbohydrate phosphatase n=1 Tax=Linderina pennispora TaxID=61395 RepID=A0A1Y1WMF4_9FUNG|nr:carbohydrate phosphatase [Linderina pennispora]ORX74741.1 carbohydrate phosphatase [Linderina pennispora]